MRLVGTVRGFMRDRKRIDRLIPRTRSFALVRLRLTIREGRIRLHSLPFALEVEIAVRDEVIEGFHALAQEQTQQKKMR